MCLKSLEVHIVKLHLKCIYFMYLEGLSINSQVHVAI